VRFVEWTVTNFLIEVVAGILGGHAAAVVSSEHSFGALGHTIAGMIGGAFSGYFLQTVVATVLTGAGTLNEPRPVEVVILQALAGAAAGAVVTLGVGFLKHSLSGGKLG
jgi:uncharacterized membrane protein YeaQ/YmgE (transglycosylase-associated protein family)